MAWLVLMLALGLAPASAAPDEPVGEKLAKHPVKTYTQADLDRVRQPRPKSRPAEAVSPAKADDDDAEVRKQLDAEGAQRDQQRAMWRVRADQARTAVSHAEARVKALESKANARFTDLLQSCGQALAQRQSLSHAMEDLDRAKADLAAAKKAVEDLEEEARRASIPPGWLRER